MPTASQLVSQGYGGYAGWGDAEANADFNATKGSGKMTGGGSSSGSSSGGDLNSYFQQQNQLQQQAIQPAIQSLQASIPTIQKNTATQVSQKQAEIQPLNDRYKALIDQIKGVGATSVNKQTVVTAGELGKRGIEGSSTLAGQEIASATLPIEQQTQSLVKDTGFAQNADLRDIANSIANLQGSQTEKEQAVAQAIAQLQAGGGQSAIQNATSILNQNSANAVTQETNRYKASQDAITNLINQGQLTNQTSKTQAEINQINEAIRKSRVENPTQVDKDKYFTGNNVTNVNGNVKSSSSGTWISQGNYSIIQ